MKSRRNSSALQAAARRRWKRLPPEERLVFVDIELVAVGRRRAILQIAAVAVSRSLVEQESFEAKIRLDESRFRPMSVRNRHFDLAQWRQEGRSPKAVACDFARFLTRHASAVVPGADGRPLIVAQLVAHNAEFDGGFLRDWFERLGLFFPASYRIFCTLHRAMWYFHEDRAMMPPRDFKLGTLCRHFGVPFNDYEAHDALTDVRATVELYRRMTMLGAARMAQSLN
jgi:DNA polymerase III epsilon subunit-like protein